MRPLTADRRLFVSEDGIIVPETDVRAFQLLAGGPGARIPNGLVQQYGLHRDWRGRVRGRPDPEEELSVREAVERFPHPEDRPELWTKSGLPKVEALEELVGGEVTGPERAKAWAAACARHSD